MNNLFSLTHLNDLLVLTWMLAALTRAYRPRVRPAACAAIFVLCLAGGLGSIRLQEALCPHFGLYMLLFVVWGCVYGAAALKGSFLWKAAMTAVYGCIVFQLGKVAGLVNSWLPLALRQERLVGHALFQFFAILTAVFLSCHAVTTQRKVPAVCWGSLMAVALIGIGLAYHQMMNDPGPEALVSSAFYALGVVVVVLIVQQLCAQVIRSHERDLVQLSLEQGSAGEALMARQAGRTEEALRRYRHETVNHIAALSALLANGDVDQARQLLAEMGAENAAHGDSVSSGNPLADAIVRQKAARCREMGIAFESDLVLSDSLPLTDAEISSLLSNLLNNAIEATVGTPEPYVRLRMYPARDYLCIEVVNSADAARLRSNPALNTTKEHPELHGIGLKVIEEIAARHNGMTSFTSDLPDQFTARVMIHL